jgi:hypothetical protein
VTVKTVIKDVSSCCGGFRGVWLEDSKKREVWRDIYGRICMTGEG